MPDANLNIWLRLQDQASRQMNTAQSRMRAFATKVRQNWMAISAAVIAAGVAIRKALDVVKIGAKAKQIEDSFMRIATAMNMNAEAMKDAIKGAAKETVNFSNVAGQVTALLGQGLNMNEIVKLMEVARVEAKKMGQDVEETFNQIAGAVTGGFLVTVKRNYGLMVDLSTATEDYAKATGKSVKEVTKKYKAQALANNIIKAAKIDLEAFNAEQKTELEHLQSLSAAWLEFKENIGKGLLIVIQYASLFWQLMVAGAAEAQKMISEFFSWYYDKMRAAAELFGKAFNNKKLLDMAESFREVSEEAGAWADGFDRVAQLETEIAVKIKEIMEQSQEMTKEQKEAIRASMQAIKDATEDAGDTVEDEFNLWGELAQNTATNIQDSFAEFFLKGFKGQLESAEDLFRAFGESMLETMSQILAQIITYFAIIKPLTAAFPGLGPVFGMGGKQLGSKYIPQTGMYLLHKGEEVRQPAQAGQGSGPATVNYYINAVDAASFQEMLYRNRSSVHMIVQENIRLRGALTNQIRTR